MRAPKLERCTAFNGGRALLGREIGRYVSQAFRSFGGAYALSSNNMALEGKPGASNDAPFPFSLPVGQGASSCGAKDLRPSFAIGRWQKAVSVALMVSEPGNSGGLHQYIKSGKNKHGLIKVRQNIELTPPGLMLETR